MSLHDAFRAQGTSLINLDWTRRHQHDPGACYACLGLVSRKADYRYKGLSVATVLEPGGTGR